MEGAMVSLSAFACLLSVAPDPMSKLQPPDADSKPKLHKSTRPSREAAPLATIVGSAYSPSIRSRGPPAAISTSSAQAQWANVDPELSSCWPSQASWAACNCFSETFATRLNTNKRWACSSETISGETPAEWCQFMSAEPRRGCHRSLRCANFLVYLAAHCSRISSSGREAANSRGTGDEAAAARAGAPSTSARRPSCSATASETMTALEARVTLSMTMPRPTTSRCSSPSW
mmetsp:Transcript_31433/g.104207  ORF Transcript_31433/g.104207 Transcript_31433/m.104207 type:complete len:232 (+) Transcript_31433:324-1019(+)